MLVRYNIEQFLPCNLPEIVTKIERQSLPDRDKPMYYLQKLSATPMSDGYYLVANDNQYHIDKIELLRNIQGRSANDICKNDDDYKELETYYHHKLIGYTFSNDGNFIEQKVDQKYIDIYQELETTWFYYIPYRVEIDVTKRCNFNCIHCAKDASSDCQEGEMSLLEYVQLIEKIAESNIPSISFMGGEPTFFGELIELAVIARTLGVKNISTGSNGWLIDRSMAKKMANLFSSVQISLHGGTAETHDKIVDCNGAYERACNAIRLLNEYQIPSVHVSFTVMKENVNELHLVTKIVKRLGIKHLRFLVLSPTGRGKDLAQWTNKECYKIALAISNLKDKFNSDIEITAGGFPRIDSLTNRAMHYGCPAGRSIMYISADKIVKPCSSTKIVTGYLNGDRSIMDLWHSSTMVLLRKRNICNCEYSSICSGGCLGNQHWEDKYISMNKQ